jgi:hypothetical protein
VSFEERSLPFSPDVIAAHQFAVNSQTGEQPEQRLMMAVLGEALFCFQKYHLATDREGRRIFAEARDWVLDESEQWPFSFNNICAALGISPSYLRRQILLWQAGYLFRPAHSRAGMKLRHSA